jgi:hypothetical protein
VKRVTICATNFTYHNLTAGLQAWALPQRKDNHARSEIWATLSVAHKQRPSHMERPANKKETTTLTLPKHKRDRKPCRRERSGTTLRHGSAVRTIHQRPRSLHSPGKPRETAHPTTRRPIIPPPSSRSLVPARHLDRTRRVSAASPPPRRR